MKKFLTAILVIAMIASIASVSAFAYDPVAISAAEVEAVVGSEKATVDVTISGIPALGLQSAAVYVTLDGGATVDTYTTDLKGTLGIADDKASFMWADTAGVTGTDSIVVATISVNIPAEAKVGDVINVTLGASDDNDNYLTAENDAETNDTVGLGATIAANGKITIVDAPVTTTDAGTTTDVGTTAPVDDTTAPADDTTVPADDTTIADEETTIADEETTIADEETTIADEETTEEPIDTETETDEPEETEPEETDETEPEETETEVEETTVPGDAGDNGDNGNGNQGGGNGDGNGSGNETAKPTGDAAIIVIATMIVALGTAIVVKKVNVK